jgi:transcriptional regulator with XRE-family HTH domain
MREERRRLGWSAAELALRARSQGKKQGVELALSQQSISAFENGTAKRMPSWFRFVELAFNAAETPLSERQQWALDRAENQPQIITMRVELPSEAALARMYEGLLRTLDLSKPVDELARTLARLLPTGLSQLQDLMPAPARAEAPEHDEAPRDRANTDPEPPRAPRT